jgi:uncharacterized repeat protein (TIGR04042 family)
MTFDVRWPDGAVQSCYSPSLVIHDHLENGARYTVAEFVDRASTALRLASERVRAKYGFACTSAMETEEAITGAAQDFTDDAMVQIVAMQPEATTP